MSKSLGTGIDPLEEIEAHGADALRFGLLAMSSAQDVKYSPDRVKQGEDLANKLWNASRLILLGVGEAEPSAERVETVEDRWIVSRLERATTQVTELLEAFQFSRAALELYDVFWSELCDWYLEFAKPRLYDEEGGRAAVSATLLYALERTLVLLHPIMPFATEEIWALLPGRGGGAAGHGGAAALLASGPWPQARPELVDDDAERVVGRTIEAITELRRYRDEVGAKASAEVRARLLADGYQETSEQIARLARIEWVTRGGAGGDGDAPEDGGGGDPLASVAIPGGAVQILPSEAIDSDEAGRRIAARRERLEEDIARAEGRLSNERFVERAPAEVVEAEREKLASFRAALERLGR
jgi:valyl-tRNA synthetase